MTRKVKSVSFNTDDPFEKTLLDYVSQFTSFSVYVKRLIQRDKEGGNNQSTPIVESAPLRTRGSNSFI